MMLLASWTNLRRATSQASSFQMSDTSIREKVFDEIGADYLERRQNGEFPSIADYCRQYPEYADELRKFLKTLELVNNLPLAPSEPIARQDASTATPTIAGYTIVDEIGRGGMGIVYEAVQESLNRHVALKVLPIFTQILM